MEGSQSGVPYWLSTDLLGRRLAYVKSGEKVRRRKILKTVIKPGVTSRDDPDRNRWGSG